MREKKKEDNQAYIIPRISPISCTISDRHCGITSFPPFEKFFHFFENCQSVNTISPTNLVAFYNFALCFLSRPKKKKEKRKYDTRDSAGIFSIFRRPPRTVKPWNPVGVANSGLRIEGENAPPRRKPIRPRRLAFCIGFHRMGYCRLSLPPPVRRKPTLNHRKLLPPPRLSVLSRRRGTSRYAELVGASDGVIFLSGDTRRA